MKYFKPWSLTWWSGAIPFLIGLFIVMAPVHQMFEWVEVIRAFIGDADPITLMGLGGGLVGLRAAPGVSGDPK